MLHLSVNVSLSAVGTNESDIMLYPNPAKDFVRLERGGGDGEYAGRIV